MSGSKPGRILSCGACGQPGHVSDGQGRCSAAYMAQRMVERSGCSVLEAAREYGVCHQTVYERIRLARGIRRPRRERANVRDQ